jgi:HEPN domain-containing protein
MKDIKILLKYWLKQSDEKWKTTLSLMKLKRYADALFFAHLTLELDLKGLVTAITKDQPPYIHDLPRLATLTGLDFSKEQLHDLEVITTFNIRTRYDDYRSSFHKKATKVYTEKHMEIVKNLHLWIRKNIQLKK